MVTKEIKLSVAWLQQIKMAMESSWEGRGGLVKRRGGGGLWMADELGVMAMVV